ncbi:hypothetical protein J801_4288 [Acinetobacter baumannii 45002_8]|nr:hypothetical protein J801_4288 [Acinetobacter baumannii 45002_8]
MLLRMWMPQAISTTKIPKKMNKPVIFTPLIVIPSLCPLTSYFF